jgi:hypothetical protein
MSVSRVDTTGGWRRVWLRICVRGGKRHVSPRRHGDTEDGGRMLNGTANGQANGLCHRGHGGRPKDGERHGERDEIAERDRSDFERGAHNEWRMEARVAAHLLRRRKQPQMNADGRRYGDGGRRGDGKANGSHHGEHGEHGERRLL